MCPSRSTSPSARPGPTPRADQPTRVRTLSPTPIAWPPWPIGERAGSTIASGTRGSGVGLRAGGTSCPGPRRSNQIFVVLLVLVAIALWYGGVFVGTEANCRAVQIWVWTPPPHWRCHEPVRVAPGSSGRPGVSGSGSEPDHWFEAAGRPPGRRLPALLVHPGHGQRGGLPDRGAGAHARASGCSTWVRTRPPRPRRWPSGASRWWAWTSPSGSSTWLGPGRPARAHGSSGSTPATCRSRPSSTPSSRCARARSAWPATISNRPGRRRRPDRRSIPTASSWAAWPRRCAPAPAGRLRLLRLLPGALPRVDRHLRCDRGVNHERTTIKDEAGQEATHDLWTSCFTPRELRLLAREAGLVPEALWSVTPGGLRRRTRPTWTIPSTCWWPAADLGSGRLSRRFGVGGTIPGLACEDRPRAPSMPPRAAVRKTQRRRSRCPIRHQPKRNLPLRPPNPPRRRPWSLIR